MRINEKKSKVMIFNTRTKYEARPRLTIGYDNDYLEVIEYHKLLGVIVRSDLKWGENTDYICKKGYSRLWVIRRLKVLGADKKEMLDVYYKQVRAVLELAVPVWQPALTVQEKYQIERVQKCALYIILGSNYITYSHALDKIGLENLEQRRNKLCENFAQKASKHLKYQDWFTKDNNNPTLVNTKARNQKSKLQYLPVNTRTDRYKKSPLPFLTDILNAKK